MVKRDEEMSRLVLGTAQLGMPYGIANKTGKPDFASAFAIVQTVWNHGIVEFDTAMTYGNSEEILGRIFMELGIAQQARVTTKLQSVQAPTESKTICRLVEESLERLQISRLECLMLHREDLLDVLDDRLKGRLLDLVEKDYVRHLGISVYSPERAKKALKLKLFHVIQVPANILDRRFDHAGVFTMAREQDCRIYIRSAFLQGLVLMNKEDVPEMVASVKPALEKLDRLALQYQLTRQALALLYLKNHFAKANVIFGAESPQQVLQNVENWRLEIPAGLMSDLENAFPELDESILNPAMWHH
jgi:aryl-alcohol dehydrogenase-like predicted oxidoreductase